MQMKAYLTIILATQVPLLVPANAAEITKGKDGSIILEKDTNHTIYKDITKLKDGLYRELITTNGKPALFTSGESDIIYTLVTHDGKIHIDCAIADSRSNQTGVPIRNIVCGIDKELTTDYAELGYSFTDEWKGKASNLDITPLTKKGKPLDITKGSINGIEIHESYDSVEALENLTPKTYLKHNKKCYQLPNQKIYTNYLMSEPNNPIGLSILIKPEEYEFKKYEYEDLKILPYQPCQLQSKKR